MTGFLREHSLPIVFSVLLHALLAALLLYGAMVSIQPAPVDVQPIPIDAVVVDSQVLRAAQRAVTERAEQDAARARAASEQQAAAAAEAESDAQQAEQTRRAAADEAARAAADEKVQAAEKALASERAAAQKAAAEKAAVESRAAELKHADEAKRAAEAKASEDSKRAAQTKQAEDAKRAADQKAKSEREAELRRQLADEERVNAVQTGPLRDQYIGRLQSRIQSAWIRPPSARVGLDCLLEVTQSPGGDVLNARVTQCNGDAAASDSIVNAAYRASPLPTPPDPALFARTFTFHFHPDQ